MRPVLLWQAWGRLREYRLSPGEYFVGRLTAQDASRVEKPNRYGVYIVPLDQRRKPVYTGIVLTTAGRRHAKLAVTGDGVTITHHGRDGRGARNPLYVNGTPLPGGESTTIPPGVQAEFKLSALSPPFIIAYKDEKTRQTTLVLQPGVSAELPTTLATVLRKAGAAKETVSMGETTVVVLPTDPATSTIEDKETGIVIRLLRQIHSEITGLIQAYSQPQPQRQDIYVANLLELVKTLDQLQEILEKSAAEEARKRAEILKLEAHQKAAKWLDPHIYETLKTLAYLITHAPHNTQTRLKIQHLKHAILELLPTRIHGGQPP